MKPEISVIVPVYNVEPYLRRCVDSILSQDFSAFELILVDDGSPDGCGAICDEYAARDSRVQVIHRPNGGLSRARNAGAALSSARRVIFVDSDDYVSPGYLRALYETAERTGADIVACRICTETVQSDGRTVRALYRVPDRDLMDREQALEALCLEGAGGIGGFGWGKLLDRQLALGFPFPPGRLFEDSFTVWRQFSASRTVAYAPEAVYFFFQRPGSIQHSRYGAYRMDLIDAVQDMMEQFRALGLPAAVMAAGAYKVCRACYVTAYRAADLPYRQFRAVCSQVAPLLREHLPAARATGRLSGKDRALYRLLLICPPLFYAAARLHGQ